MKKLTLLSILFCFLFFQCQEKQIDPCETWICQNGGDCVDGVCDCPEGWEGSNCQTQVEPVALKIDVITVSLFPVGDVDNPIFPDMYVAISKGELSTNNEFTTTHYQDVTEGNVYNYIGTVLDDVNSFYTVSLYDYDEQNDDEEMGSIVFRPIDYVQNFRSMITLFDDSIPISIRFEVEWVFN